MIEPWAFATRYGPWAIVAGASEGVGRELARSVSAKGVSCVLLARRVKPLAELAEQIRAESGVEIYSWGPLAGLRASGSRARVRLVTALSRTVLGDDRSEGSTS